MVCAHPGHYSELRPKFPKAGFPDLFPIQWCKIYATCSYNDYTGIGSCAHMQYRVNPQFELKRSKSSLLVVVSVS